MLYASLAALVGVIVVAVGGGGIAPMRQRWERTLAKVEAEAPRAAAEARGTDPVAALRTETQSYAGNGGDTRTIAAPAQTSPDGGATGYRQQ